MGKGLRRAARTARSTLADLGGQNSCGAGQGELKWIKEGKRNVMVFLGLLGG